MQREELAWAAGFFDDEGHIGYSKAGSGIHVNVSISNTDLPLLERRQHAATDESLNVSCG